MWPLALLIFVWCFAGAYFLLSRTLAPRLTVAERLGYYAQPPVKKPAAAGRWSDIPVVERVMGRFEIARSLESDLDQADLPIRPFEFVLISAVAGLGMAVAGLLVGRRSEWAALMGGVGLLVPFISMRVLRNRRRQAFARQLPDALHAISNALRAGYGFGQGVAMIASDHPRPISVEFARAQREMNLGLTLEDVLHGMAKRIRNPDFDLAVSGILINRQVGGNLAELLDRITATIRERVKLKRLIQVLTAEQRFSATIIVAVPPTLLVILFVAWPEYTSYLLVTRVGQILLAAALCLQVLGAYVISKIVTLDV